MCPIAGGEKRGNLVVVIVATALSYLLRKEQHFSLDSSGTKKTSVFVALLSFLGCFLDFLFVLGAL